MDEAAALEHLEKLARNRDLSPRRLLLDFVAGAGFTGIAVVIRAERSQAFAAAAFFTRTSAYDALVM